MDERMAHAGETMVFSFSENPTTGYRWQLVGLPSDAQLSSRYEGTSMGAGGGGLRIFEITLPSAGTYQLMFFLKRPWESAEQALSQHSVQIRIE